MLPEPQIVQNVPQIDQAYPLMITLNVSVTRGISKITPPIVENVGTDAKPVVMIMSVLSVKQDLTEKQ